jgi:hypothetical protein
MNVVISEGFRRDLQSLSKENRRHAWDAIDKLIESPNIHAGGLQVKKMKSFDVYEIRATQDLRILARRDGEDFCCVRVGAHDKTLKAGAEGRLGAVPDVGRLRSLAAETESAIVAAGAVQGGTSGMGTDSGPLGLFSDAELHARFGVPTEWIPAVRSLRTEEQFASQELENVLSETAWYELATFFPPTPVVSTGAAPTYRVPTIDVARAFADGTIEELEFNLPASSWAVVERSRRGPLFVRGGPGSGKSLLGLYRALHALNRPPTLDRPTPRVLYATFTRALAEDTREKVVLLRGGVPDGLEISTVDRLVERYAPEKRTTIYDEPTIAAAWHDACLAADPGHRFDEKFVRAEVEDVIIARGLRNVEAYLSVSRTGRARRLGQGDRRAIWAIFVSWEALLAARGSRTLGLARIAALDAASALADDDRYDLVVVDEVQDLTTTALGLAIGLARGTDSGRDVTLIGDGGQSIYRAGFKWADVGIRLGGGNVVTLATCERSSPEIMRFAAALSGRQPEEQDEDTSAPRSGNERPAQRPRVRRYFADREDQRAWLISDLRSRLTEIAPRRIAVIARTRAELDRVREALTTAKIPCIDYGDAAFHRRDAVRCITAHSAKGLEFGDVYVIGADDGSFPLAYADASDDERAEKVGIDARLLYVAVTRARERITILCGSRPSPFLTPALGFANVSDA